MKGATITLSAIFIKARTFLFFCSFFLRQLNFKNNGLVLLLKMLGIETVSCPLFQRMARIDMPLQLLAGPNIRD